MGDNRIGMVQSTVSRVMHEHGRVDPDRADREASDIATKVAVLLLETVFHQDAELRAQREMADAYRKIAEDVLRVSANPNMILRP